MPASARPCRRRRRCRRTALSRPCSRLRVRRIHIVVSAAGAITRSMEAMGVRRFVPKAFDITALAEAVDDVLKEGQRCGAASLSPGSPLCEEQKRDDDQVVDQ